MRVKDHTTMTGYLWWKKASKMPFYLMVDTEKKPSKTECTITMFFNRGYPAVTTNLEEKNHFATMILTHYDNLDHPELYFGWVGNHIHTQPIPLPGGIKSIAGLVKSITFAAPAGVKVLLEDDAGGVCFIDGPTKYHRNTGFTAAEAMTKVSSIQSHDGDNKWRFSLAQVYKDGKSFYSKNLAGNDGSNFVWAEMIDKDQQPMVLKKEKQRDYCSKAMTLRALGQMSLRDVEISLLGTQHPEWDAWKATAGLNDGDKFSKLIRHFIRGHVGGPLPI